MILSCTFVLFQQLVGLALSPLRLCSVMGVHDILF